MKNILILGHSGYVGGNLKLFFQKKNFKVITLSNRSDKVLKSNIKKVNIIINCVGENYNTSLMKNSNFSYVKKILKFINKHNKNIFLIHLSSCAVYGELFHNNINFVDENSETRPISLYAITKLSAELLIKKAYENKRIKDFAIIRPSQIISEDMKSFTYLQLIKYVKKKLYFYISNVKAIRNYVHINDLVNFIYQISVNRGAFGKNKKLFIISRSIKLVALVNYIKNKLKIKSKQFIFPKFFIIFITNIIKFFYPKFPLSVGIISGLSSSVIIKSNIKNFKFNFHIFDQYIKFVTK